MGPMGLTGMMRMKGLRTRGACELWAYASIQNDVGTQLTHRALPCRMCHSWRHHQRAHKGDQEAWVPRQGVEWVWNVPLV